MSDEEKLVSHYRLKTPLRRDGFGAVYLSEDTRDQKECVLRIIELDQATLRRITGRVRAHAQRDHPLIEQIRQRMKRIAELKNSHILPVIEFGEEHIQGNNDIIFYMVSPYEKESLLSYWSARTSMSEMISLEVILEIMEQAAEALHYVHRRGLVHQYVRLSSFMLRSSTRSRKLHLYLTDFWFADITAHLLEEGQVSQDLSIYLASEQLAGKAVAASDQYALAILIYELLLGYRLSSVDLSLGLYEQALRQRNVEVSEAELLLARRLDLVLRRALAEDASARYRSIDVFASTFRAAARGEAVELLEEDTAKLPIAGQKKGQQVGGAAIAAAGALAAGEIVAEVAESQVEVTGSRTEAAESRVEVTESQAEIGESRTEVAGSRAEIVESQIEETTRTRHPSLHKTVLTSAGMEATEEVAASGEVLEATTLSQQATISSLSSETLITEEESLTVLREERTSGGAVAGAAGFAAGLVAGEMLQSEADLTGEQTSSAAAFAAGEVSQRERDRGREEEARTEGAAAGLVAGEVLQSEADRGKEERARAEGAAAGLLAGEVLQREADLSEEQRLRAELAEESRRFAASNAAAFAAGAAAGAAEQREIDREEERTQLRQSGEAAFAAGAAAGATAGFAAGEAHQREIDSEEEKTERRESAAAGFVAGAAAGLLAGEALAFAQETDITEQQTQIIGAGGGASGGAAVAGSAAASGAIFEQETDISDESTQIIPVVGGIALGAAGGLVAGELLAEEAGTAGVAGGGVAGTGATGAVSGSAAGGSVAGLASEGEAGAGSGAAGLESGGEAGAGTGGAGLVGGAAAGLAGGAIIAGAAGGAAGLAGGIEKTQVASGGVAGAGAGGGMAGGSAAAGGMAVTQETQAAGAAGLAAAGLAGAELAASGYASGAQQAAGGAGVAVGGAVIGGGVASGGIGTGVMPSSANRRRRRNWLLAAVIAVLLFFILGGGIFVFALNSTYSATVTITRESHTISSTNVVTATTSSTTTTSGQVQAVRLTQSASMHKSGQATGYYQGSHSTGFIRFYNASTGCGCPIVIPAGTAFTGASGVTVVTDEAASVSALCYVTVHAHAVILGPGGNIPAQDIRATYSSKITVTNPFAFGGGQVGQSNVIVQQSDIDRLAKSLKAQVIQSAQASIQAELQSNQHLFAQPDCQTKTKANHAAGEYAANVTVTVSATCTAEAYDYSAAIAYVTQKFQTEISSYSDNEYTLVGGVQTSVTSATVTDAKAGTILLVFKTVGKWLRNMNGHLEERIAGQSVSVATDTLKQLGAATVDISFSVPNKDTLPDASRIKIIIKG